MGRDLVLEDFKVSSIIFQKGAQTSVMKKYHIEISESLRKVVSVTANSPEEALDLVEKAWKNEQYVLGAEDFDGVEFQIKGNGDANE